MEQQEQAQQQEHGPSSTGCSDNLLATHDALPLLLQHAALTHHPRAVCALMCASAALRVNVAQQCRGQLPLEFSSRSLEEVGRFAAWLARWVGLGRTLDLEWNRLTLQDVEASLAAALQQAAAHAHQAGAWGGPLQLRAVKANVAGPLLLAELQCPTLTSLELGHVTDYLEPGAAAAALQKLTGLESLTVLTPRSHLVLPAAAALTALTHACILVKDLQSNAPVLRHLPPQLRKLELTVAWGPGALPAAGAAGGSASTSTSSGRPPLPLAHLTGVTELRSSGYFRLQADDELPPHLLALQAPDCHAVKPLLQLKSLRTLNLYNCTTPATELTLLGRSLTHLSEVSLGYFGSEQSPDVDCAAPGWPGLPLRSLDFDSNCGEFRVGSGALGAMGRLGSCLTQLALSGGIMLDTDCAGLCMVLSRLTQLHTLRLAGVELVREEAAAAARMRAHTPSPQHQPPCAGQGAECGTSAPSSAAATAAPAGLQGGTATAERDAHAWTCTVTPAACVMAAVAGLSSLRSLKLGGLSTWMARPAGDLAPLAGAVQLTCLHLMDMQLSQSVVRGVVCSLSALRELDVSDNGALGDATLACLGRRLPGLRNLDVSGTGVSAEGVQALKDALPGLDVVCFQSSDDEWL